ncbi:hypothetical protein ES319_D02G195600v1 [Gossypium barbadense]|uniref:Uncharacterized protein n=1 Tax=Gossypium barbadense TaxID=3634 RepID=A0A5J5SFC0_GOSBA|nr:hypothetical protein ES319_D02G195600v1 [Gossypium barbadense]
MFSPYHYELSNFIFSSRASINRKFPSVHLLCSRILSRMVFIGIIINAFFLTCILNMDISTTFDQDKSRLGLD